MNPATFFSQSIFSIQGIQTGKRIAIFLFFFLPLPSNAQDSITYQPCRNLLLKELVAFSSGNFESWRNCYTDQPRIYGLPLPNSIMKPSGRITDLSEVANHFNPENRKKIQYGIPYDFTIFSTGQSCFANFKVKTFLHGQSFYISQESRALEKQDGRWVITIRQSTPADSANVEVIYDSVLARQAGADDYGMKTYFMAFLKSGPNRTREKEEAARLQQAHLDNIKRMAEMGKLVLAGPFVNNQEIRGIYIFAVDSIEEAQALTASDPAVQAGSLVMELHPWYGPASLHQIIQLQERLTKTSF